MRDGVAADDVAAPAEVAYLRAIEEPPPPDAARGDQAMRPPAPGFKPRRHLGEEGDPAVIDGDRETLATLRRVRGSDFEVVRMAGLTVGREGD